MSAEVAFESLLAVMIAFAPVVCALDLDPSSEPALLAAAELAARTEGLLHLVTVIPDPAPDDGPLPTEAAEAIRAVVELYVDRALGEGACADLAPRIEVTYQADAAGAVIAYAARARAATLVLGTHGRRGLQRFRLGSVAEEAVRRSSCPVLVVPNASTAAPGTDRPVLVPVDFSEPSARALATGAALADLYGAPLEVLYALDLTAETAVAAASGLLVPPHPRPTAAADLHAFAAEAGVEADRAIVASGAPIEAIVRRAEAIGAGAVVMGTHGRDGLAHAVFGSVTEAALRRLACPALTVH